MDAMKFFVNNKLRAMMDNINGIKITCEKITNPSKMKAYF